MLDSLALSRLWQFICDNPTQTVSYAINASWATYHACRATGRLWRRVKLSRGRKALARAQQQARLLLPLLEEMLTAPRGGAEFSNFAKSILAPDVPGCLNPDSPLIAAILAKALPTPEQLRTDAPKARCGGRRGHADFLRGGTNSPDPSAELAKAMECHIPGCGCGLAKAKEGVQF